MKKLKKLKKIFIDETQNSFLQFFRYLFVGGIATIVDWSILFFTAKIGIHYLIAAIIGFVFGLIVNFLMSKKFVFSGEIVRVNIWTEFFAYALIGLVGLGLTEIFMFLLTEIFLIYFMISKMISTVIVLVWNYLARKIILYKKA